MFVHAVATSRGGRRRRARVLLPPAAALSSVGSCVPAVRVVVRANLLCAPHAIMTCDVCSAQVCNVASGDGVRRREAMRRPPASTRAGPK
eukprot:scaffold2379_cov124-Isochrysis_galbana.AAC.3